MKRILLSFYMFLLASLSVPAQEHLWATGSAVPDGTVQLTRRPDGKFSFTGALSQGELKIMTTAQPSEGTTQYLAPQLADSYLVNYGLNYQLTTDASRDGWVVSFQEDSYRFIVDTGRRTVQGELLLPWNEVLIAGSAFEGGSDHVEWIRDNMLPFTRDHDDPYVFTWTGYLGVFDNVVEPGRFKLEGQSTWGPRELHPYTQDENLLQSTQMRQGGDDTKWRVTQNGNYRITVDLFHETFRAELLDSKARSAGIGEMAPQNGDNDKVYDLQGMPRRTLHHGLNIVRSADGRMVKILKR